MDLRKNYKMKNKTDIGSVCVCDRVRKKRQIDREESLIVKRREIE